MVRCVPGDGYSMPMVGTCLCDDYGVLHAGSREGNQYQDLVHQIPGTDSRCVGLLVFFLCDHPPQAFLSHRIAVGSFLVPWNADRAISLDPHPEDYRTEQTGSEILLLVLAGVDDLFFPGVFGEYPGYCLFAYLLKTEYADKEKSAWPIYLLGIIGLLVTVFVGLHIQSEHSPFYSYSSPNVIFTSLALFLAFVRNPFSLRGRMAGWMETVSRCTFGIYLIHLWLLTHLFTRIYRFVPWPIPLIIISVGVVFCLGFAITWTIKQIPILNKYIV